MHSDFARRIAAEYGTILHERGFCAVPRCCDCRVGNFDRRARNVGRYVAAYGVKVGYLVRERYLGSRVYLVSVNVRIAVYRARKRGAVCEHFDYFVFLRRYGYYDRIAEVRFAVGYARNGAVSVRVVHTPVSTTAVIAASISAAEVENEYSENLLPVVVPLIASSTSTAPIEARSIPLPQLSVVV